MTLEGVIETHVHAAPDVRVRSVDDWGIVESAEKAGIRAVVIKNHFFPTVCRAADMQKVAQMVASPLGLVLMFGGVILGAVFGAIPGLTGSICIAIMLPITYGMDQEHFS